MFYNLRPFKFDYIHTAMLCSKLMLVCSFLILPFFSSAGAGKIEKRSYFFKEAEKDISYCLYVPNSYSEKEKIPLIVLLHGLGSNPQQVIRYKGIVEQAESRGYIVVAPFGYNERGWYGSRGKTKKGTLESLFLGENPNDPKNVGELSEMDVMNVLQITKKEFNIDSNRIYLMGHSMGGGGTIYLGNKYASIWAGLAPMSPAVMRPTVDFNHSILEGMRRIPIYLVTGERDRLIPVSVIRQWADKMKKLQMNYKYEEIKGGNHFNSITRNAELVGRIYDFFDKQSRQSGVDGTDSELRVFTHKSGAQINASVLSLSKGKVTILRKDGKKSTIPIDSLSDEDVEYLKVWWDKKNTR